MITETQSSGYDIRDAFFNLLDADPYFAAFTRRKTKMLPVQQNLIPYLGVYLAAETMLPDGDANAGCVRFLHNVRIGFSLIIANSVPETAEQLADQAYWQVMKDAYTNLYLMNVLQKDAAGNNNPENVKIEAIVRGDRKPIMGAPSTDNETPFVEMQYEATCSFRSEWYPDITDMLDEIDVTTGVKPSDTPAEQANRQQVAWTIDLNLPARRAPRKKPWLLTRDQNRRIGNG
jgi:hypothetical protein